MLNCYHFLSEMTIYHSSLSKGRSPCFYSSTYNSDIHHQICILKWMECVRLNKGALWCGCPTIYNQNIALLFWLPPTICFSGFALSFNPLSSGRENNSQKSVTITHFTVPFLGFPDVDFWSYDNWVAKNQSITGQAQCCLCHVFTGTALLHGCFFLGGCIHSTNTNTGTSTVLVQDTGHRTQD